MENFNSNIRCDVLKMIHSAKSGHPGGCLSCVEIMSVLYNKIMFVPNTWKSSPDFEHRDRFILSKGHASATLYSILARKGFFPVDELMTFRKLGSRLQGHPSSRTGLQGVEVSTGSLGQGLSMAVGVALALRLNNLNAKVYTLLGDGEMQEGSVWEALMSASHKKLDNLVAIIDKNRLQIDGETKYVKTVDPLDSKLSSFGWHVEEVDGHDCVELEKVLLSAKDFNGPFAVIANTVKGKGVSFMENNAGWHGKAPNDDELQIALEELNAKKDC